jgi:hypothetical protein
MGKASLFLETHYLAYCLVFFSLNFLNYCFDKTCNTEALLLHLSTAFLFYLRISLHFPVKKDARVQSIIRTKKKNETWRNKGKKPRLIDAQRLERKTRQGKRREKKISETLFQDDEKLRTSGVKKGQKVKFCAQ